MASFAALENRRRSTIQNHGLWLEYRVRQVSRRLGPVTPLHFLAVTLVQFIPRRRRQCSFSFASGPTTGINADDEVPADAIERLPDARQQSRLFAWDESTAENKNIRDAAGIALASNYGFLTVFTRASRSFPPFTTILRIKPIPRA